MLQHSDDSQAHDVHEEPSGERRWRPTTLARPRVSDDRLAPVDLSNSLANRRVAISREALIQLIRHPLSETSSADLVAALEEIEMISATQEPRVLQQELDHWHVRNWIPSLDFFLWSRRSSFFDDGAAFDDQRRDAIEAMLAADPLPKSVAPATEVPLPFPVSLPYEPLGEILRRRASTQRLASKCMPAEVLSGLLHHGLASGRLGLQRQDPIDAIANPINMFHVYLAVFDVKDMSPGIYRYEPRTHATYLIRGGMLRSEIETCLIGQHAARTASCTLLLVVQFERVRWLYRHPRELRVLYIMAGKLMQDLLLVATALGLRTAITPAIVDSVAAELLNLDTIEEQALYTLSLS